MSNFLKKALVFLSSQRYEKKKVGAKQKEADIPETGQPQETETTQTEKEAERTEEETKEMKIKDRGKLFVGGLDPSTTTDSLKAYFTCFGSVVDAVVMRFPDSKKSRGYGFVTFADPVNAECALTMKSHVIDGKSVDLRPFESSRSKSKSRKRNLAHRVFLGGIPFDMNEEDLKNFMSRYGEISELFLPLDGKTNKPKGYAFLSFEEEQAAEKCLSESFVHLGNKRVVIKKASARSGSIETMSVSDLENGVDCLSLESAAGGEDDALSLPDDDDDDDGQSSASGGRTSLFGQDPEFLKVLENYFQPKIALYDSSNKMERKEESPKWQPPVRDIKEMEKLLARFFINSSRQEGATFSDEDVTDDDDDVGDSDCDDGEESVSDEEENDYDDSIGEDEDEDDNIPLEKGSVLDLLSKELRKTLLGKTTEGKIGNFKSSVHENKSIPAQKHNQGQILPFTIKDKSGSWKCSLCQWTPPDGQSETFLAHCNTLSHKMKIKERFMPEDLHATPETLLQKIQEGPSQRQNEIQIPQEQGKKKLSPSAEQMPQQQVQKKEKQQQPGQQISQKQKNQQQQPGQQISQKQKNQQQQPGQQISQKQKNQQKQPGQEISQKRKNQQQQPGQEISQKQKNQQQQPGQEISQKQKNQQQQPGQQISQKQKNQQQQPGQQISQKQKNQQETKKKKNQNSENSSETAKIKNGGKIPNLKIHALAKGMVCIQPVSANELKCKMCDKKIPKSEDFGILMKNLSYHLQSKGHLNKLAATEDSLKSALDKHPEEPVQVTQKKENGKTAGAMGGKKEQGPAQKGPPKGKNPSGINCDYKTLGVPKANFLCLPCNYFANKQETFSAHISSKVHLEAMNKTDSKSIQFGDNSVLCKSCNRYLWGSLYDINKHNSKCSK